MRNRNKSPAALTPIFFTHLLCAGRLSTFFFILALYPKQHGSTISCSPCRHDCSRRIVHACRVLSLSYTRLMLVSHNFPLDSHVRDGSSGARTASSARRPRSLAERAPPSINSASNHQPVLVPIAQHGSLDVSISDQSHIFCL